ncbi:MAG: hypothetical protein GC181_07480 [Bacteroidetes bacterium]|nr:hypothetical protein [Bacteroidota bacterium]
MRKIFPFLLLFALMTSSCDNHVLPTPKNTDLNLDELSGTGSFVFTNYAPLADKPVKVYYHIPDGADKNTPILIGFHGSGRDGENARNILISHANRKGVIVIVPDFSNQYYPGGDEYNLGNLFTDGDYPTDSSLNPEDEWTFSLIHPLFEYVADILESSQSSYSILGFSAGAQFAHRLLIYKNDLVDRVAICSPGWWTTLDEDLDFPYGLKISPYEANRLPGLLSAKWNLLVGALDNDPNASSLRRNDVVDLQGTNRYDRTLYFYHQSEALAGKLGADFNWTLTVVPGVAHDLSGLAGSAFDKMFP